MQAEKAIVPSGPLPQQTPEQAAALRRILEQQGKLESARVENLIGSGVDLWDSDEDFEAFLEHVRKSRRGGA